LSDYAEFEEEVLARSKRILFNGNESFVGLSTPDAQLNRHYLYIMFNAIMHKIISYKRGAFLSYEQYTAYFAQDIQEVVVTNKRHFYYLEELVLIMGKEQYQGVMRDTLTPCDKTLIDKDVILMKAYRARKALLQ
tara:strand:- start:2084 stop:2488 length:405 start_codon:yes stop_codon:yes gene_type:complete